MTYPFNVTYPNLPSSACLAPVDGGEQVLVLLFEPRHVALEPGLNTRRRESYYELLSQGAKAVEIY